jgi:hypothetical protein
MVVEDISPRGWLTREVFANFGLAMHSSQVLEHGIVNLVVWSGLRDGRYRVYEETEAASAPCSVPLRISGRSPLAPEDDLVR